MVKCLDPALLHLSSSPLACWQPGQGFGFKVEPHLRGQTVRQRPSRNPPLRLSWVAQVLTSNRARMNPHRVSPKTPRINDDLVDLILQRVEDLIQEARDERLEWPQCWTVLIFSQDLSSALCNNSKGVL